MLKRIGILLTILFITANLFGNDNFTFQTPVPKVVFSVGTHQAFLGFELDAMVRYRGVGLPLLYNVRYNFKSLGSRASGFESRLATGINFGWGKNFNDTLINVLPLDYYRQNNINYSLVFYADQFKTIQLSGILRYYNPSFVWQFENDFFSVGAEDKYRTGAFMFGIRAGENMFTIKNISFTGDPYAKNVPWIKETDYPGKYGFKDMSKAPLGNFSSGILAVGLYRFEPTNTALGKQLLGIELGIDHERIRHFFQNRLIHDSKLINAPDKGITNPHIPMLDNNNLPYLFKDDQTLKPVKLYLQAYLNNYYLY